MFNEKGRNEKGSRNEKGKGLFFRNGPQVASQNSALTPFHLAGVLRTAAIFWLGFLLTALHPNVASAQTGTLAAEPSQASAATTTTLQPLRRQPAPRTLHGSISGSQANPLADHAVARLFDRISEQNRCGFDFYGYLDQGVTLNPDSPRDRINGPVLSNYRSNDYQMNGLYMVGERKIDPKSCHAQLGGRIDMIYGTDAACGLSLGLDEKIVSDDASRFYKLAFPQIYANLFLPIGTGVSFKVGHFYSPIGNEWLIATENFFYSHFFSWNVQPGTHTGMLAEFKLTDSIDVQIGPNLGWNTSENSNHNISWLGSLDWKSHDQRSEIYYAIQTGNQSSVITVAPSDVVIYSLIANQKINDCWHYMLEHDLLVSDSKTGNASDDFEVYSLANYLFYTINDRWRAGLRFEWLRDKDGFLSGFDPTRPSAPGSYYDLTLGLNWHLSKALRVRPELRRDWQVRDSKAIPAAFDDGTSTNQWLIACDVLLEF